MLRIKMWSWVGFTVIFVFCLFLTPIQLKAGLDGATGPTVKEIIGDDGNKSQISANAVIPSPTETNQCADTGIYESVMALPSGTASLRDDGIAFVNPSQISDNPEAEVKLLLEKEFLKNSNVNSNVSVKVISAFVLDDDPIIQGTVDTAVPDSNRSTEIKPVPSATVNI